MDSTLPVGKIVVLPPGQGVSLEPWERDALTKLRLLRQLGKPAMLYLTESGAIQVFRCERAGLITF